MSTKPRTPSETRFWEAAFLAAWERCLQEHGLTGAIGCAHIARDAANAALAERRNSLRGAE